MTSQQSDHHGSEHDETNRMDMSSNPEHQDTNPPTPGSMPTIEAENTMDLSEADVVQPRKRKLASEVWNHLKKEKIEGVDKEICNHCQKKLSGNSKNGTTHLREHLARCPLRKAIDIRQCLLTTSKNKDGTTQLKNHSFDPELARLHLAYMIVLHEYPLRMIEYKWFRVFINTCQPLFKTISRNTLRSDIMKIFVEEKSKVMSLLEGNRSRIAITTDMWTSSNQKKGYMAITAHFIDDTWTLCSKILRFAYVPCPHTAEVITNILFECLLDWNIDRKLSTLTLDNCSTNDYVASILVVMMDKFSPDSLLLGGEILHMRCAAHILNLIVKDGIDAIGSSIERIWDSVYFWTATPKRVEKFEETARQLNIRGKKKLAHDVKTRWNSIYLMLSSAMPYKDVFPHLKQRDPAYKALPTDDDWVLASEVCEKLALFYELTNMFSGTKYVTANKVFMYICEIRVRMNCWLDSGRIELKIMAKKMIEKYNTYWEDIHKVFSISVILDPRFKFKMIDFYFDQCYGENVEDEKEKVRNIMLELEKKYKTSSQNSHPNNGVSRITSSSSHAPESAVESVSQNLLGTIHSFEVYLSDVVTDAHDKSEFESYLEEKLLPIHHDFDILTWWKTQGIKYPTLRQIARDIFAIPVSTVASEAAFSTSGRIVTKHRSRLIPETLEALMCSQDWLWEKHNDTTSSSSTPRYRAANEVSTYSSDEEGGEDENVKSVTT